MVHGSENSHHGLDGVAVHHRLVLRALVSRVAVFVDDPVETIIAPGALSRKVRMHVVWDMYNVHVVVSVLDIWGLGRGELGLD